MSVVANEPADHYKDEEQGGVVETTVKDPHASANRPVNNGEYHEEDVLDRPPDGTLWAWIAAACVCSANTFSWGVNSAFGVYLNYYLDANVFPGATKRQFAMIGSLSLGISYMFCQLGNVVAKRYPLRVVMSVGLVIIFVAYWLASIAKTVTQLVMFQGLLMGVGFIFVGGPATIILPTWFLHKRSIASGIGVSGAGLSGLIFSRSCNAIIDRTGSHVWALRMMGLVCGAMLAITIVFIRPRKPFNSKDTNLWHEMQRLFDKRIISLPPVLYICAWCFVYNFAYTILLFSYSSFSTSIGLTYEQGAVVTTVQNVAQLIGRPALGYISDKLGRANVSIACTLLMGLFSGVFWVFVTTYSQMLAFAFLSGLILGTNWVNYTSLAADAVGSGKDMVPAISFICVVSGLPYLVSEVIALELVDYSRSNPFFWCQIFVTVTCIIGGLTLLPYREWKIRRILTAQSQLAKPARLTAAGWRAYLARMFYPIRA